MRASRYEDPNHKPDGSDLLAILAVLVAREPERRLEINVSSLVRSDFLLSVSFQIREDGPYLIVQRERTAEEVAAGSAAPIVPQGETDEPSD